MNKTFYLPYLAGVFAALIFGFSYLFIDAALDIFTPFELLAYRFALAAAVLTLLAAIRTIKIDLKGKPLRMLLLLSFFQPVLYFICETMSVKYTSVSETGIFVAFIPIFVMILAYFILKEKPYGKQAVFILISVSGAVFNVVMSGGFEYRGNPLGIMFLTGIVLTAGGYNILCRKSSEMFSSVEITFVMMWAGAVIFNVLHLTEKLCFGASGSFALLFTVNGAVPIVYLGIFSSIGAFFSLNYMLSKLSAASASVYIQAVSVVTILSGIIVLGETLRWFQIIGGLLILTGAFGTNYYENKMRKEAA
jgi:drug/metabolite transporter (DMT)-like permease